jgi:hypothetical protein
MEKEGGQVKVWRPGITMTKRSIIVGFVLSFLLLALAAFFLKEGLVPNQFQLEDFYELERGNIP